MTATERITMVVLNDDGSREKFTLSSWVGIPRKHELMWIGDDPYMIIEVEYAVSEGFFGARSIDAAGVYVRRLTKDEQDAVARRLANPVRGKDEQPFRSGDAWGQVTALPPRRRRCRPYGSTSTRDRTSARRTG
ncbi:MAG: hypothetical protein H6Q90_6159 [Deltaproteobacteria bacterium]|nr:hypothetical protein [Deltaproteobacteria bacterium]